MTHQTKMQQPQARPGQLLTTHLTQVGNDMAHYFRTLNAPTDLAQLTGYLHDLEKFSPKWQNYLTQSSQGTWKHDRIPHAIHGALQAWDDWASPDTLIPNKVVLATDLPSP
jgi:HD superfamily phosphohydrolase YqeK